MAAKSTAIQQTNERADYDLDRQTMGKVIDSVVLRGDLSGLAPGERARFYVQMCEGLGLNPASQPFAFLRLNGKEILYATRGATDQLAAMHRVTREIIDGPKVVDLGGTKLIYAVCKASMPNGRFETATATVPLIDPVNVMMKAETKAKRRATLSLLGLGLLDEIEIETIPAGAQSPGAGLDLSRVNDHRGGEGFEDAEFEEAADPLAGFHAALPDLASPDAGVDLWIAHRPALNAAEKPAREAAFNELGKRLMKFGGGVGSFSAATKFIKRKLGEHDERARAGSTATAEPAADDVAQGRAASDPDTNHSAEVHTPAESPAAEASPDPAPAQHPALGAFYARVEEIELPGESAAVWMKHRADLAPLPVDVREPAWRALVKRTEEVGRMKNATVWLKKAIAEEDARRGPQEGASTAKPSDAPAAEGLRPDVLEGLLADIGLARDATVLATTWAAIAEGEWHDATPAQRVKLETARTAREKALRTPPTPPKGTRARATGPVADATGSGASANDGSEGARASAGPRLVLDADEAEARILRDDAAGDAAWRAHLDAHAGDQWALAIGHAKRRPAMEAAGVDKARRGATLDALERCRSIVDRAHADAFLTGREHPKLKAPGAAEVIQLRNRQARANLAAERAQRTGTDD